MSKLNNIRKDTKQMEWKICSITKKPQLRKLGPSSQKYFDSYSKKNLRKKQSPIRIGISCNNKIPHPAFSGFIGQRFYVYSVRAFLFFKFLISMVAVYIEIFFAVFPFSIEFHDCILPTAHGNVVFSSLHIGD